MRPCDHQKILSPKEAGRASGTAAFTGGRVYGAARLVRGGRVYARARYGAARYGAGAFTRGRVYGAGAFTGGRVTGRARLPAGVFTGRARLRAGVFTGGRVYGGAFTGGRVYGAACLRGGLGPVEACSVRAQKIDSGGATRSASRVAIPEG